MAQPRTALHRRLERSAHGAEQTAEELKNAQPRLDAIAAGLAALAKGTEAKLDQIAKSIAVTDQSVKIQLEAISRSLASIDKHIAMHGKPGGPGPDWGPKIDEIRHELNKHVQALHDKLVKEVEVLLAKHMEDPRAHTKGHKAS
jgi:hypothetical protein